MHGSALSVQMSVLTNFIKYFETFKYAFLYLAIKSQPNRGMYCHHYNV